ncbi:MAG: hypothetical protein QM754_11100 [Tepidisphaeraceae bacterium]
MADPIQIDADLQAVLDHVNIKLTRAKTTTLATLRSELACVLCIEHRLSFRIAAHVLGVHVRSINRYVSQQLERDKAIKEIRSKKHEKMELNSYFGLLDQPAELITLRDSDSKYLDFVLHTLTQTQRRTLYAFFYEWKSVDEIADDENVSIAAIRKRIERIKGQFALAGLPRRVVEHCHVNNASGFRSMQFNCIVQNVRKNVYI